MTPEEINPAELERLFRHGLLSRRGLALGLAGLGMAASGIEMLLGAVDAEPAEARPATPRYFVLIVLDAFRPDYMNLAPMPFLQQLIQSGTSYTRAWVGQLESETPTGHATLSTGALPKHHGVLGFEWRDPQTGREALDGWPPGVLAGALERDLQSAQVNSIPRAVKSADPRAKVVAISSEKVYAADAMGAAWADYVLHCRRTPGKLISMGVPRHEPPRDFFNRPHLQAHFPLTHFTNWDYLSAMLAVAAVKQFRPKVLMVNLPGPDYYGHPYGGPATPSVMRAVVAGVDRDIGRILQAYRRAGIFGQTLFVVTADHGMVPNVRMVPDEAIRAAVKRAGGHYLFHTGGTAAYVYLQNPGRARAVAAKMARLPNVVGTYYRVVRRGSDEYLPAPGSSVAPSLDAAFHSLLGTFAGARAPDVVVPFRENTIGNSLPNAHGSHGGLNWGSQAIPLVFSGPGVRPGLVSTFPARLLDVAPTVLHILGLPAHRMDGIVLADTLVSPAAREIARQTRLAPKLAAHQDAIIALTLDNIAEDQRAGLQPPPSLPPRP